MGKFVLICLHVSNYSSRSSATPQNKDYPVAPRLQVLDARDPKPQVYDSPGYLIHSRRRLFEVVGTTAQQKSNDEAEEAEHR